jgi:hypothetical protein
MRLRTPRQGRCTCGLRVVLHFTPDNRKLTCAEAADAHRWAGIRFKPLRKLMLASLGVR